MCYLQERDIYVDKARRSRYYSYNISARTQGYLHTQDFRGASRYKPPFAQGIEASQLGMSSGLQQFIRSHETESHPDSDGRKQVSPSQVTLFS